MIVHVILFEARRDLTPDEKRAVLDAFARAAEHIPTVKRCRIGRRVTHGLPGYEGSMRGAFEFSAIVEFDDLDGLKTYLMHPAHVEVGHYFTTAAANALAYDYEMAEVSEASRLV